MVYVSFTFPQVIDGLKLINHWMSAKTDRQTGGGIEKENLKEY